MSPLLLLRDLPSLLTPSPSLLDARRPRALLPLALLPFLTGDLPRAPTAAEAPASPAGRSRVLRLWPSAVS